MDELGVARAIAAGELTSPQKYQNVWLFALRITGTGASYRSGLDEYVWRDPSIYLNDEFLARCNGLAVVLDHPERGLLNGAEYEDRSVGSIMLPYIREDEVWGIAKIYDEATAALLESEQYSTSPAVNDVGGISGETEDGKKLLVEGKPKLLDHIAICARGVWDKGGPPSGVSSVTAEDTATMADETKAEERKDAASDLMMKLDAIAAKLDSAHSRMDALEERHRKDADEREKGGRDEDKARRDARKDEGEEEKEEEREDRKDRARRDARKDKDFKEWAKEEEEEPEHRGDEETEEEREALKKANETRGDRREDRKDRARRDAEERKDRGEHRVDADLRRENADLKARLADIEGVVKDLTRETPPEERDKLAAAQARADSIAALFGERITAPTAGETELGYRRRVLKGFLKHSEQFKDARLDSVDGATLNLIENQVYADSQAASRVRADAQPGILIPRTYTDAAGRQITKFDGDMMAWLAPFMTDGARCTLNRKLAGA